METIYANKKNTQRDGIIPWLATEARKCEELIAMGWEWCNGVNIAKHLKRMDEEITRIEELRRKSGGR